MGSLALACRAARTGRFFSFFSVFRFFFVFPFFVFFVFPFFLFFFFLFHFFVWFWKGGSLDRKRASDVSSMQFSEALNGMKRKQSSSYLSA